MTAEEPAALWDAHGPRAYAFAHRVLGEAQAAADAAQDGFLLAWAQPADDFRVAVLHGARTACFERLGRAVPRAAPRGRLSAAAARLRPQQRAALALAGLERLSYAEIAAVLAIEVEAVPALLARARLRLHDELHGTALAAAAVRRPDCEDVLALLASGADGELDAADSAWADPHVDRCPTCVRTIRAMDEAAATYAAWSAAPAPSWLRAATLADLEAERADPDRGGGVGVRAALPAALVSATCVTGAFAALLVGTARSLHEDAPASGGARLPESAHAMQLAAAPVATPRRHHRARHERRPARATTFVAARVVQPAPAAPAVARPVLVARPQRTHRPSKPPAAATPAPAPGSDAAPSADAATPTAVAAAVAPAPDPPSPPASKVDVAAPPPAPSADDDRWAAGPCHWHDRRGV